ncbi:EAL domain-containing protein [Halomonas campisalis]|uniref:EAL domain-containing protein n=1 Tax=Billgrantia campisalis TaxID=74661 RepID=A0ABS9P7I4_9GAMM|nr:EAL domain-containing protein [Halomonas campisalis]MCG6657736.1 EAL domain-containing protein [Halomonas campisalis]MDR5862492.1 EAL domain-containing protein [Halomonas campisalis]
MTIRNLLITLLTVMGLLILVGSSWEIREIRAKQGAAEWVHQSNRVADLSLRASGVMAMERGITAAILSRPDRANPEMLYEMAEQRHSGDELYRSIAALASRLTGDDADLPLSRSLAQLARHRDELASARQQVDRLIAGDASSLNEQQWIRLATRHIEVLSDLRDATNQPKPGNLYSHTPNPVIKEVLFNASEHAGRERAIVGAAIAQARPLSESELARLQRYRDIVDASLERADTLIEQLPDIPKLAAAREALEAGFLGDYQALRQAVYAASREGEPYPVSASEWYQRATSGIATLLALSESVSEHFESHLGRLRDHARLSLGMVAISIFTAVSVFLFAVWAIRSRILHPLRRLEVSMNHVTQGHLDRPLPRFRSDEIGALARAFEQLRISLIDDIVRREASEAELRKLSHAVEQSADSVIITDRHRNIEYVNSTFERLRGYRREDIIGMNARLLRSHERNPPEVYQGFREALEKGETFRTILINLSAKGELYYEEMAVSPLHDDAGEITHYVANGRDVTERMRTEQELKKLNQAIDQSVSSIVITDANGITEYVNPQFTRTTGYRPEEIKGRRIHLLEPGRLPRSQYQDLRRTLQQGKVWEGEILNRRKDGQPYWELTSISPVRNQHGIITHFVGIQYDISERKQMEEQINLLAYYDDLTNLPNRTLLAKHFDKLAARALQRGQQVALLSLDISRFHLINDSLGHRAGDQVLQTVGQRLGECARGQDMVARYAGDEFVVILTDVPHYEGIAAVAQRMIDSVYRPMSVEGQELHIDMHAGISVLPQDGQDLETLLSNATTAQHIAAREGQRVFRFFTEDLNAAALKRLALEQELRRALEHNALALHYQPKVDFASGEVVGMEALARWHHPSEGPISPMHFIPVAEETGLIQPLGEWALREACRQGQAWQNQGLGQLNLAVNLSARQLQQPDLAAMVGRVLADTGFPPELLELELTESAVMERPEETIAVLKELKALGVRLAVDDFGTGYSSLAYLRRFPFDTLKIDRSFITNVTTSPDEASIAQTIIAMGHGLRLQVVAEGVETLAQAAYLRRRHCDQLQGYLFSRPLPTEEMTALLKEQRRLILPSIDPSVANRSLLVLDPDPEALAALSRPLQDAGYRPLTATHIEEAFDLLALNSIRVVIGGLHLPDMPGLEFHHRVRALYPEVACLALATPEDAPRAAAGVDSGPLHGWLDKGCQEEALLAQVQTAFSLTAFTATHLDEPLDAAP